MTDPKYLTDEGSEATALERELLHAAQAVRLAPQAKQAIWASVALKSAVPQAAPGVTPSKLAVGLHPALKALLLTTFAGGLSASGYWLSRSPKAEVATHAQPSTPQAIPAAAAAPEPALARAPAASAEPSASTRDSSSASIAHDATSAKSALRDESAAVLEIRRTLRAGDANSALHLLDQAHKRFPKGALSQEREALSIEALAKSGAAAAAARKAQTFLRAYPKSPYAADVQSYASQ